MKSIEVAAYEVAEICLGAASDEDDSRSVDVTFVDPSGRERRVPAFTRGREWWARYSSGHMGAHRYRGEASDGTALPIPDGEIHVAGQLSSSGLWSHGPLRVSSDQRHLEHADRTPFLWLADTWWHGFAERLSQAEFGDLAAKRARQGFSVVQIVAGFYPEVPPFAPAARSTSGWAWHEDFSAPNLAWFDEADGRILELVRHGLVPCIMGSWAYYLEFMDAGQILRHWREMIARWSAYPVVWCLAGEPPGIWRDDKEHLVPIAPGDPSIAKNVKRLNDLARAVRRLEPFGRPITIHSRPGLHQWQILEDESVVDFWLLQTGHWGPNSLEPSVNAVHEALAHEPAKPVINGESCYEGIAGSSWQDTQRFLFWSHMLSGAAGHSYGAHGIWAFNTPEVPGFYSGLAPTWKEAAELPGASQVGLGRRMLLDLPWHEFEPHPEWVEPHQNADDRCLPYAAGLESGPRVFYFPGRATLRDPMSRDPMMSLESIRLRRLGHQTWQAQLVNPRTGEAQAEFSIDPGPDGTARLLGGYRGIFALPSWEDWLLVLRPDV